MSKYSGTDYRKYALVLELLGLAKRITKAGYHIRFVPGLDTYWRKDDKPQLCTDTRPCYARQGGKCRILNKTYDVDGQCPFCKRRIDDKTQSTIKEK